MQIEIDGLHPGQERLALTKEDKAAAVERLTAGLNPEQKEAVLTTEGPVLILAGAGSGKTRVITHRIAYLVECCQVWPSQIMAITFTNKAANEMKERVDSLLGFGGRGMWVGTFHSMMLRILRQHAEKIAFKNNFTILDSDDQLRLVKEQIKSLNIDEGLVNARQIHSQISMAKNKMQDWQDVAKEADHSNLTKEFIQIYQAYQKSMQQNNSMDFDDILLYTVKLFKSRPDVLEAYQERFRYIMVDEYQDTNHVQYALVKLLSGKHKNICVVGDDDQSIYSFRGANIENILSFEKDFKQSKVIKLEQNYRSTQSILGAANAVIRLNRARTDKKLWTRGEEGEPIHFYYAESHYEEARYVAAEIRRLLTRRENPLVAGEIGVLYRVNALSRGLEFALREQGINYSIYGGLRFYDRREIRDFLAYLRLVFSPDDDLALTRIINQPKRGIGNTTLERISALAGQQGLSMLDLIKRVDDYPELSRVAVKLKDFAAMIDRLREIMKANAVSFKAFCQAILNESGLVKDLEKQHDQGVADAQDRANNLQEILSDAIEFEDKIRAEVDQLRLLEDYSDQVELPELAIDQEDLLTTDLSLTSLSQAFLERASLYSDLDQADQENTVRMMAIHSAKGLEFDAVFIIGMEESVFPGYRSFDEPELMEEERRLAYVGITRAKKYLHLTAARSRLLYGKTRYDVISRFLSEIPDEYIREIGGSRKSVSSVSDFRGEVNKYSSSFGRGGVSSIPARDQYGQGHPGKKSRVLGSFGLVTKPKTDLKSKNGLQLASLKPGQKFNHKKFGQGTLKSIDYVAKDAILTLDFSGVTKRMMASSAPLEAAD